MKLKLYEEFQQCRSRKGDADRAWGCYWSSLLSFMRGDITKGEFDEIVLSSFGDEGIQLHNEFILGLLHNAQCTRLPCSQEVYTVGIPSGVKLVRRKQSGHEQQQEARAKEETALAHPAKPGKPETTAESQIRKGHELDFNDGDSTVQYFNSLFGSKASTWIDHSTIPIEPTYALHSLKKRKRAEIDGEATPTPVLEESTPPALAPPLHWEEPGYLPQRLPGSRIVAPQVQAMTSYNDLKVTPSVVRLLGAASFEYCRRLLLGCVACADAEPCPSLPIPQNEGAESVFEGLTSAPYSQKGTRRLKPRHLQAALTQLPRLCGSVNTTSIQWDRAAMLQPSTLE